MEYPDRPPLRVSSDRTIAMNASEDLEVQEVYATAKAVNTSNAQLALADSGVRLHMSTDHRVTLDHDGQQRVLYRVKPEFRNEHPPDVCRDFAAVVLGGQPEHVVFRSGDTTIEVGTSPDNSFELTGTHKLAEALANIAGAGETTDVNPAWAAKQIASDTRNTATIGKAPRVGKRYGSALSPRPENAQRRTAMDAAVKQIGANQYAWPKVSEGYVINAISTPGEDGRPLFDVNHAREGDVSPADYHFGYHFGAVVLSSEDGNDQVTLENFNRPPGHKATINAAIDKNLDVYRGQFETILNDLKNQPDTADESQRRQIKAKIELATALRDLERYTAEGDQRQARSARTSAGRHLNSLGGLAQPQDLWHFRMYSNQPGQTFHEQRALLYSDRPSRLVNPLTAVVVGGHGPRVPRAVAFQKRSTVLTPQGRSTVRKAAAEQARDAVWRRNNRLDLATVEFIGHGNGTWPRRDATAKLTAKLRAEVVAKQYKEDLQAALARLQEGRQNPITIDDIQFTETPAGRTHGEDASPGVKAEVQRRRTQIDGHTSPTFPPPPVTAQTAEQVDAEDGVVIAQAGQQLVSVDNLVHGDEVEEHVIAMTTSDNNDMSRRGVAQWNVNSSIGGPRPNSTPSQQGALRSDLDEMIAEISNIQMLTGQIPAVQGPAAERAKAELDALPDEVRGWWMAELNTRLGQLVADAKPKLLADSLGLMNEAVELSWSGGDSTALQGELLARTDTALGLERQYPDVREFPFQAEFERLDALEEGAAEYQVLRNELQESLNELNKKNVDPVVAIVNELNADQLEKFRAVNNHDRLQNKLQSATTEDEREYLLAALEHTVELTDQLAHVDLSDEHSRLLRDLGPDKVAEILDNVAGDRLSESPSTPLAARLNLATAKQNDLLTVKEVDLSLLRSATSQSPEWSRLKQDIVSGSAIERAQVLENLPPQARRMLATDPQLVDDLKASLSAPEFAQTAAQLMVHVPREVNEPASARRAAQQQAARMLNDPDTTANLLKSGARVVVVPSNVPMTSLAEFSHLQGLKTNDGRYWDAVRGSGGLLAAMTEENLLGKTTSVGGAKSNYPDGYSTATHEFGHTIYEHGLSEADRRTVIESYQNRLNTSNASWPDGPMVSAKDGKPTMSYGSTSAHEYFAQITNAYLGTNGGMDPFTGQNRNNSAEWVRQNAPELVPVLTKVYGHTPNTLQANSVNQAKAEKQLYADLRMFLVQSGLRTPTGSTNNSETNSEQHSLQSHPNSPQIHPLAMSTFLATGFPPSASTEATNAGVAAVARTKSEGFNSHSLNGPPNNLAVKVPVQNQNTPSTRAHR
ncbi:hypothetical protein FKR81_42845 [Lentzea tibetensis]|uniref:Uncharacterized protein n=1 Tax=Lentzea tibetensis TaxID=2591470 RepID=A0A563EEH5_9PSEU|nr:hypothetical protein [Lentzea tibetensis]TWP43176.1 hypothetical protein FKR81_42845 [Lentzea tibetensis]